MTGNILRNWFVAKDGISREVISADIQRYLGNDATVRPGKDNENGQEIDGYWIRAYRNLTTEMINDLKVATQKWDREQHSSRRVTNYEDSHTYRSSTHAGFGVTASSPQLDGPFQPPASRASMPIQDMSNYADPRNLYPAHSLPPQTTGYVDPASYVSHPSARQPPQPYTTQPDGGYYASMPSYAHEPPPSHLRSSPKYGGPQYNAPYPPPPARDPREDPRYNPEYQDQSMRYNYPPVTQVPNGAPISSPSQTPSYPPPVRYDQYGRPFPPSQSIPDPPYRQSPSADVYRERPSGHQGPEPRRRRIN
ncbi:hypothetical protein AAFC00_001709 [Neodothiora populina]|uniref:Transcription factor RfeG n=1 Tax=Neodothiora populina TaxID=2781224 RepID=A0ABR3PPW1_9PEZI